MTGPHTEIREALTQRWPVAGDDFVGNQRTRERVLAALDRLEREAAERETALAETEAACLANSEKLAGEGLRMSKLIVAAEARVREVEAERDRQAETLRDAKAALHEIESMPPPMPNKSAAVAQCFYLKDIARSTLAVLVGPEAPPTTTTKEEPCTRSTVPAPTARSSATSAGSGPEAATETHDHEWNPDDPAPYAHCVHCGQSRDNCDTYCAAASRPAADTGDDKT